MTQQPALVIGMPIFCPDCRGHYTLGRGEEANTLMLRCRCGAEEAGEPEVAALQGVQPAPEPAPAPDPPRRVPGEIETAPVPVGKTYRGAEMGEHPLTMNHQISRLWTDEHGALHGEMNLPAGLCYGVGGAEHQLVLRNLLGHLLRWCEVQLRELGKLAS